MLMVIENIVQKLDMCKEKFPCSEGIVITDLETGEVFCQKCGIVQNNSQDRKNSALFSNDDFALRNGSKTSLRLYDMGLSTNVGNLNHDSTGKPVDYKMKNNMKRMRLWDSRSKTKNSSGRNLKNALVEIEKLKEKLTLTDTVAERSAYIYRKAAKYGLIRGRSVKDMSAACVYMACREFDVSRTILDISNKLQVKRSAVAKNYRLLFQNLRLNVSVPDPIKCIIKISNNFKHLFIFLMKHFLFYRY
ncbi:Transcription initiation factor IIB 6 protein [Marine Group I thaumarchaeote SCGC AAA799-E16]|uniref:Transcription initiation factor IIB 6 protein n=4 Tax=Marine Group I TaxID=905826 RepID=A0A081RNT3_9ARCH|nr:Transcription initiation factor IIB 6 protein [Marine Group I thaumarchaeote SCGC AAA799-N04]KER05869.1 Transcription initiation factor IIB 6 protein [Marine Group I thaumarchaeote SCGC AAA799-E16]KFM16254.1 Transcription initiation factor IIB 6 protein [Marine Group I thaumarchaeote SCGC AAA799-D11]KFM16463.1 Transcription initiation factor IIB protein [Marine Group I thaumarchaeote SCGC RSA3]